MMVVIMMVVIMMVSPVVTLLMGCLKMKKKCTLVGGTSLQNMRDFFHGSSRFFDGMAGAYHTTFLRV